MRINVLISTTRQWNPGDEFIMLGCINILKQIYGDVINPIIFNRNPDIRGGSKLRNKTQRMNYTYEWDKKTFKGKGILQDVLRIGHYDNSYKDDMNAENIDIAIFAGSPEWYGRRLLPMYRMIEQADIPTLFLGIGAGDSTAFEKANPVVNRVLQKAKLITTRDLVTEELLEQYHAKYLPCPALLAAQSNRLVEKVEKIGLIYATDRTLKGNNVSGDLHKYLLKLYPEIMKRYDVNLICHYIDEIDQAKKEFPNTDICYSYDARDYTDIYNQFDLVLGGRVHGIGMAASLGIPGIMIKHDSRSSTTDGFLATNIEIGTSVEKVINLIEMFVRVKPVEKSHQLIEHKIKVMQRYITLICNNV